MALPACPPAAKSKAEIHIKVDDKGGHVKNVQLKSSGETGFTLGHTMPHSVAGAYHAVFG